MDGAAFTRSLDAYAAVFPEGPIGVALDNVGHHKRRRHPARIRPLRLAAYAPELNLIERV